jgi:hypothetical protein
MVDDGHPRKKLCTTGVHERGIRMGQGLFNLLFGLAAVLMLVLLFLESRGI